jgi:hypothetical protein
LIALFNGLAGKCFPLIGRVAQFKFLDGFATKTTLFKIAEAYALPFIGIQQTFMKEFGGKAGYDHQAFAMVLFFQVFGGINRFFNLDAVLFGQPFKRFGIGEFSSSIKKVTALPPLPDEKSLKMPLAGDTVNDGVRSLTNGDKAHVIGPAFF